MATVEVVWGTVAAVLAAEPDPLTLLDAGERARLERLTNPAVRGRFLAGRVLMRRRLAARLGCDPQDLRLGLGPRGKPDLEPPAAFAFNLAHTADAVALALAPAATVGLDVELVRALGSAAQIARRRFTPAEAEWLSASPAERRQRDFFRLWTAKEALLKALGHGIAGGLASVELAEAENGELRVTSWPWDAPGPWTLLEAELRPGLLAAVALPQGPWQLATTAV